MEDVFRFVTFVTNIAVVLLQFVLSVLSDKPSAGDYVRHNDVRELPFCGCHKVFITEFMSGAIVNLPISFDLVVAEWVWTGVKCVTVYCFIHGKKFLYFTFSQVIRQ